MKKLFTLLTIALAILCIANDAHSCQWWNLYGGDSEGAGNYEGYETLYTEGVDTEEHDDSDEKYNSEAGDNSHTGRGYGMREFLVTSSSMPYTIDCCVKIYIEDSICAFSEQSAGCHRLI